MHQNDTSISDYFIVLPKQSFLSTITNIKKLAFSLALFLYNGN
jgi:hypothetical protein